MAAAVTAGCTVAAEKMLTSEDDLERIVWVEVVKQALQNRDQEMKQQAILNANYVLRGLFGKK